MRGMKSHFRIKMLLLGVSTAAVVATTALAQEAAPAEPSAAPENAPQPPSVQVAQAVEAAASPVGDAAVEQVLVTARRRAEDAQEVPVALSVIGLQQIEATGSYNVAQLTQLTPSVQFFSSNPRNTAITIRGL